MHMYKVFFLFFLQQISFYSHSECDNDIQGSRLRTLMIMWFIVTLNSFYMRFKLHTVMQDFLSHVTVKTHRYHAAKRTLLHRPPGSHVHHIGTR